MAEAGDKGCYRGSVELVSRRYGILDKGDGSAALLPVNKLTSQQRGEEVVVRDKLEGRGERPILQGIQPTIERSRDRGLER